MGVQVGGVGVGGWVIKKRLVVYIRETLEEVK